MHQHPRSAQRALFLAVALALGSGAAQAANITVTDGGDAGTATTCTLRQALDAANGDIAVGACPAGDANDTISFAQPLTGSTITLGVGGQLEILAGTITVQGSGQTIDADHASRVLYISSGEAGPVTATLSDLTLTNGYETNHGAGLSIESATVTLIRTTIAGNHGDTADAGGLYADYAQLTIIDSTISGNTVSAATRYVGGGLYLSGSQADIRNSTISGNSVVGEAVEESINNLTGGLYSYNSSVTVDNCTLAGNSATGGFNIAGALSSSFGEASGPLTLVNTTVSGNTASVSDPAGVATGGLMLGAFNGGTATLQNSILAVNHGANGDDNLSRGPVAPGNGPVATRNGQARPAASTISLTTASSLFGASLAGTLGGTGNLYSDTPALGTLASNGGLTQTMALQSGSPALDAGNNALVPAWMTFDQRGTGFTRIINGTVDMGSYEAQGASTGPVGDVVAVPATSTWGKALLAMLMAGCAGLLLRRRSARDRG